MVSLYSLTTTTGSSYRKKRNKKTYIDSYL